LTGQCRNDIQLKIFVDVHNEMGVGLKGGGWQKLCAAVQSARSDYIRIVTDDLIARG
jgi:hypothetical protein